MSEQEPPPRFPRWARMALYLVAGGVIFLSLLGGICVVAFRDLGG